MKTIGAKSPKPRKFHDQLWFFQALSVFPQLLPEDLERTVTYLHTVGNAPTSGDALINYELPRIFEDKTGSFWVEETLGSFFSGSKYLENG